MQEIENEKVESETEVVNTEVSLSEEAENVAIEETTTETQPVVVEPEFSNRQKMNLPNKLTLLRIALVPVMVILFYIGNVVCLLASVLVFVVAAITDMLDGHIARKNDIVTDFGKFLDPIADKTLVITAIILLVSSDIATFISPTWIDLGVVMEISLIIIVAREFAISGLRLLGANNGVVIAADKFGKIKTILQTVAIPVLMLGFTFYKAFYNTYILLVENYYTYGTSITEAQNSLLNFLYMATAICSYAGFALFIISTVICILSGISYLVKNKAVFLNSK